MKLVARVSSLLLTATVVFTLSACGQQPKSGTSSSSKTSEQITLTVITSQLKENESKDSRVKALYDSIDKFMDENSNVKVEAQGIASEPYNDKMKVLAAGDELPDMCEVLGSWANSFVDSGLLMELNDFIDADQEWKSIIKPTATKNFTIDGKIYGICVQGGGSSSLLFYNEDILKSCGVSTPINTMAEFEEAITAVKTNGYTPIALGNKGEWVGQSCYLSCLGGRYTGEEWNNRIANNEGAKFTDDNFVKALALMQKFSELGAFNSDLNSIDYLQKNQLYYDKKAAMFIDGSWAINTLNAECPEDVLKATHVSRIPEIEGAKSPDTLAGGNGSWAFSLSSKLEGDTKDAAVELLKDVTSKDAARTMIEGGNDSCIVCDDYDTSNLSDLTVEYFKILDTSTFTDIYDSVFSPTVVDAMNKGTQLLLINEITPEKLAETIQKAYESSQS